jgi:hypothetical protein
MKLSSRLANRVLETADAGQSPDCADTRTTDGGGLVLMSLEVAAIFWGSYWSKPSPFTLLDAAMVSFLSPTREALSFQSSPMR